MRAGEVYDARPDLTVGHEQMHRRPVVVLSEVPVGSLVFVAPLTTSMRGWPTRVRVDVGGTASEIMCEQTRAIDVSRLDEFPFARVEPGDLAEARSIVAALLGVRA